MRPARGGAGAGQAAGATLFCGRRDRSDDQDLLGVDRCQTTRRRAAPPIDELVRAYGDQVRGLWTAASICCWSRRFSIRSMPRRRFLRSNKLFDEAARQVPVMASVTFIQAGSNRGFSGQTVEGVLEFHFAVPLLSVGINCALGPKEMRPLIEELSQICADLCERHPNAGLPNPLLPTGFPETPESLAPQLREWAENGWLNIVGGCCGTTPAHIQAIAEAVRGLPPRSLATVEPFYAVQRLEALTMRPETNFVNIGERTNVTGSPEFSKLILAGDYEEALAVARQQVEGGAQIIDINMDEGMLDSQGGHEAVPATWWRPNRTLPACRS